MPGTQVGQYGTRGWEVPGKPVEYSTLTVKGIFRQLPSLDESSFHWTLNPYVGCELACTFCEPRLAHGEAGWAEFSEKIQVKANAVELMLREARQEDFRHHPVVLGSHTEPWQQAEERFRVTRAVLEAMLRLDAVDLRVNTRSSLIARDVDLLKQLAAKGPVSIAFSLASLDEKVNRLMEPKAPSAMRRLAALEALARAGLNVGLVVSPVFPGLDEKERSLEHLLTRAANAGARFAGIEFLRLPPGKKESFLEAATRAFPENGARFRRVVGVRPTTDAERARVQDEFDAACAKLGLLPQHKATQLSGSARHEEPAQLALFS